jgi:hypothetical protein
MRPLPRKCRIQVENQERKKQQKDTKNKEVKKLPDLTRSSQQPAAGKRRG